MQIHTISFTLACLALTATALPMSNILSGRIANQPTSHSNFSIYCGNVTPYGTSTSTISAWCSQQGYNLAAPVKLYESHINLSQCLTNINGKISARANGGAMTSCTFGEQGIQVCPGCADTVAAITCKDNHSKEITNKVDLNEYIGVEWQDVPGDQSVPVISCTLPSDKTDNRGVYDGCEKLGAVC